jgi:hypothetical protein
MMLLPRHHQPDDAPQSAHDRRLLLLLFRFGVAAGVAAWCCFLDTISLMLHMTLPAAEQTLLQVRKLLCKRTYKSYRIYVVFKL